MALSKQANSRSILHYDPDRVDYAVTEDELRQLEEGSGILWKDVCLLSAPAFACFGANALVEFWVQAVFQITPSLFVNSLLGTVSFVSTIVFGVAWRRSVVGRRSLLAAIRNKPRVILRAESLEVELFSDADRLEAAGGLPRPS